MKFREVSSRAFLWTIRSEGPALRARGRALAAQPRDQRLRHPRGVAAAARGIRHRERNGICNPCIGGWVGCEGEVCTHDGNVSDVFRLIETRTG